MGRVIPLIVCRVCPTPAPAGDKPPRYISPLWIPAFAGMTSEGRNGELGSGFRRRLCGLAPAARGSSRALRWTL